MQKTLIFDFDGTIVDSTDSVVEMYNLLAGEYNYKKITPDDFSTLKKMSVIKKCEYLSIPIYRIPFYTVRQKTSLKITFLMLKSLKE